MHKRTSHGMILGEGGEKMSKSRGNVVNPNDDRGHQYGADTMRLYMMFIGDFEKAAPWSRSPSRAAAASSSASGRWLTRFRTATPTPRSTRRSCTGPSRRSARTQTTSRPTPPSRR
ncbi:MAG: class I tRNA ligase family protein [Evtepia sp.]